MLPSRTALTALIIKDVHERELGHIGSVNWNANQVKKTYWILRLGIMVRKMLSKCYDCARRFPEPFKQTMSPLHKVRQPGNVGESETPFAFGGTVQVDFAGPWETKQGEGMPTRGRGVRREKRYLAVFACALTRAVHLEVVPSMDTKDCLLAFLKFFHRRGLPKKIVSDNGSNLKRSDVELKAIYESVKEIQKGVDASFMEFPKIEWEFVSERTPHQNGGVERMISTVKRSLTKISVVNPKNGALTDHELEALFVRVEGIMNGRPLTKNLTNTGAEQVLTPQHFILGNGNNSPIRLEIPKKVRGNLANEFNARWLRIEEAVDEFWQRMQGEFLEQARKREKWNTGEVEIEEGDLVMVLEDPHERLRWPVAEVLGVERDQEGRIQTVKIRFRGTETRRGVRQLAPIPFSD